MTLLQENYDFIEFVRISLVAKGYKVEGYMYFPLGSSTPSASIDYFVSGYEKETKASLTGELALLHDGQTAERMATVRKAKQHVLAEVVPHIPPAKYALQNAVLRQIEKVRDLAIEADLPVDFINPIEAMAERLRTNILEDRRNVPFRAAVNENGDDIPF